MKKVFTITTMLFLGIVVSLAQVNQYNPSQDKWTFGLNAGLAYQQADVPSQLNGFGAGFTLGKSLFNVPGAPLSFDIRGRMLFAKTYGLDYLPNNEISRNEALNGTRSRPSSVDYLSEGAPGFVYNNHKTNIVEGAVEGVITLNRLKERTNVLVSLFGGVGLDWYNTKIDQLDGNQLYDYANMDLLDKNKLTTIRDLETRLDGDYETVADGFNNSAGRLGLMPNLGIELGYQFSPSFAITAGHRMSFAGTDVLDGVRFTPENDKYHYTSLGLQWTFNSQSNDKLPPEIHVDHPAASPFYTPNERIMISADIERIKKAKDIQFLINGKRFDRFSFQGRRLNATIELRTGRNEILIVATNSAGTDREVIEIFVDEKENHYLDFEPAISFIFPSIEAYETDEERSLVKAYVHNVDKASSIVVKLNGSSTRQFKFDSKKEILELDARLNEGVNRIEIEATNKEGKDRKTRTIIYRPRVVERPSVRFLEPNRAYSRTEYSQNRIIAEAVNVASKNDIRLILNGRDIPFSFRSNTGTIETNVTLRLGKNEVEVEVNRNGFRDSDEVEIEYRPYIDVTNEPEVECTIDPPKVNITKFRALNDDCDAEIKAVIENIERQSDIEIRMNGKAIQFFDFNLATGVLTARTILQEGRNVLEIIARNDAGRDSDQANTNCQKYQPEYPAIQITKPSSNGVRVEDPRYRSRATISNVDSKRNINVWFNGKSTSSFDFNSSRGIWEMDLNLTQGRNTVRIEATNQDGRDEATFEVVYSPREIVVPRPPVIMLISPSKKYVTVDRSAFVAKANIVNVSKKEEVEVKVNGRNSRDFSFNSSGKWEMDLRLKTGSNTVEIIAQNSDGSDRVSFEIIYKKSVIISERPTVSTKPKVKPTIRFVDPVSRITDTRSKDYRVRVDIKNATKENISVLVNERKTNFTWDSLKGLASFTAALKKGNNKITVTASNSNGSVSDYRIIKQIVDHQSTPQVSVPDFETGKKPESGSPKIPLPSVKITEPSKPGLSVYSNRVNVRAEIKHVTSGSDIVFLVNGKPLKNFTFNPKSGRFVSAITLVKGNNSIVITAKNKSGKRGDESSIKYIKVEQNSSLKPVIDIVKVSQPTSSPLNPDTGRSSITAKISNVDASHQIKITVNGSNVNFKFNGGTAFAVFDLKKGENLLVLTAQNIDGTTRVERKINFNR